MSQVTLNKHILVNKWLVLGHYCVYNNNYNCLINNNNNNNNDKDFI